ncbi:tail fiber domain-containing protein [Candidatus Fukatsuia endosymbiont of Tuberolachnus salignus]|uniref:tail fiber domain-containing protein n=1 Tax=Candidatus Fukatsuia endosymbiont of Tuberolachnus salignus TaxID=3077957 RepID=UPI00313CF1BC
MPQKTRAELKDRFKRGDKPTAQDFSDLFESFLNVKEDWIKKPEGVEKPLRIMPQSDQQNWLDFCVNESSCDTDYWRLNHQPQDDSTGFNLSYEGKSRLFIDKEKGKTGIGTFNPGAQLHIQSTKDVDMLRVGTAVTTALFIEKDGKVGINHASPSYALDIQGEVQAWGLSLTDRTTHWEKNGTLYQRNGSVYLTTDQGLHLRRQGSADTAFHFDTTQRTLTISTQDVNQISIEAKGYIKCNSRIECQGGIHIDGASAISHWNSAAGAFYRYNKHWYLMVDNNLYFRKKGAKNIAFHFDIDTATLRANKFQQASDRRIKTNIKPLGPVLDKIQRLQGIYYDWSDHARTKDYLKEPQIGLIADELQASFPELVACDQDNFKYVDYGRFTAVLLEAVKQQQQMIAQLFVHLKLTP